jgi:hypothetical protein
VRAPCVWLGGILFWDVADGQSVGGRRRLDG